MQDAQQKSRRQRADDSDSSNDMGPEEAKENIVTTLPGSIPVEPVVPVATEAKKSRRAASEADLGDDGMPDDDDNEEIVNTSVAAKPVVKEEKPKTDQVKPSENKKVETPAPAPVPQAPDLGIQGAKAIDANGLPILSANLGKTPEQIEAETVMAAADSAKQGGKKGFKKSSGQDPDQEPPQGVNPLAALAAAAGGAGGALAEAPSAPTTGFSGYGAKMEADPLFRQGMGSLLSARENMLATIAPEIEILRQKVDSAKAAKQPIPGDQGGGGGGGGGLGLGGVFGAIGKIGSGISSGVGKIADNAKYGRGGSSKRLAELTAVQNTLLNRQYQNVTNSFEKMYDSGAALNQKITGLNARVNASPEGELFLKSISNAAASKGCSTDEIRAKIHDLSNNDSEISALRKKSVELCSSEAFKDSVDEVEREARDFRLQSKEFTDSFDQVTSKVDRLKEMGIDVEGLKGLEKFGDIFNDMNIPDADLAPPDGEKADGMRKKMKELADRIKEMVENLINRISSMFSKSP